MTNKPTVLQPPGWPTPRGYANGMMADGRIVVTGGVVGWDIMGNFPEDFVAQVRQTLSNIRAILVEGGAEPHHLVRLNWYVLDIDEYVASLRELGRAYREIIGAHYPAMAVVQVVRLVEKAARVEIEATAVVPRETPLPVKRGEADSGEARAGEGLSTAKRARRQPLTLALRACFAPSAQSPLPA